MLLFKHKLIYFLKLKILTKKWKTTQKNIIQIAVVITL
jgi:hypothetical protein